MGMHAEDRHRGSSKVHLTSENTSQSEMESNFLLYSFCVCVPSAMFLFERGFRNGKKFASFINSESELDLKPFSIDDAYNIQGIRTETYSM